MKFIISWNKCTNIPGMPPRNFRKIYHTELEISLYLSNLSNEVANYQTDRHTKNSELFGTSVPMSRTVLKKLQKDISSRSGDIPLSNFGKEVSKQTNWKTNMKIQNYLEIVNQHPRNVSKNFRKIYNPELEISQYLCNFSKKVSQITD